MATVKERDHVVPGLFHRVAKAFTYRDFRVLWMGAFTSTTGTWMQKVAQSWLVLSLTGSAFYLGLDDFLAQLPILLFTMIGGVIADRHDRRRLLIGSQYVQMTSAFILATLVVLDVVRIWHVLALSFLTGIAQAFGGPAYQSLIPSLVPRADLPNAIALNSIQFNLARVVGPLLAGVALAAWGTAVCFGLNGLSFIVVIVALMWLRVRHTPPATRDSLMDELRGGLSYMRQERTLMTLTALAFVSTFLGLPLLTFLPIFAQDIFQRDAGQYAVMMAFSGAGAVVGALVVAGLGKFKGMGKTLLAIQVLFGLCVTGFALSRSLWLSYLLLFASGASLIVVFSLIASLVQLIAPDHLRGRVVSIYMVAFRGGMPLGSLAAGYAASLTSAPLVLAINGALLSIVAASVLTTRRALHEI
ncbi:MAG TPA: MFS transporter [Candidatus Limnocylindrales bacterium]|nr:MFS transporter [Candidatus Limnocylindrales bacterium]